MVVLDQQQPGKRVEEASKGRNPILVERGAEGILGAGHDHHCFRSLRQRGFECPGDDSLLVHRHRHGDQAEREQDVPDRRIGRILDHDPVARPEVGLEEALDGVQRAGDDGYRLRGHAVRLEPAPSGLEQNRVGTLQAADQHSLLDVDPGEGLRESGKQARIGKPDAQVAEAGLIGRGYRRRTHRRAQWGTRSDAGAATAFGDHQPPLAENSVGGVDGRRTGPERARQRPYRRQGVAGLEQTLADRRLRAGGDLARSGTGDVAAPGDVAA